MGDLPAKAQIVQRALVDGGFDNAVTIMPDSTRTAADAAAACGCTVAQIAKSIVFRAKRTDRPVLVVASGVNRVSEKAVGRALGEKLGRADADFVRDRTGFAIGGVGPIGHVEAVEIFIDQTLMEYDRIWAAAGTPNAVFSLTPTELVAMTGGRVIDIG